jgi:hypothetical protein
MPYPTGIFFVATKDPEDDYIRNMEGEETSGRDEGWW